MGYRTRRLTGPDELLYRGVMEWRSLDGELHQAVFGPYTKASQAKAILTRRKKWHSGVESWIESTPTRWNVVV